MKVNVRPHHDDLDMHRLCVESWLELEAVGEVLGVSGLTLLWSRSPLAIPDGR
jgi:hypothetical protein